MTSLLHIALAAHVHGIHIFEKIIFMDPLAQSNLESKFCVRSEFLSSESRTEFLSKEWILQDPISIGESVDAKHKVEQNSTFILESMRLASQLSTQSDLPGYGRLMAYIDSQAVTVTRRTVQSRLVKLHVETRATFATIFDATQVARSIACGYHKIIDSDVALENSLSITCSRLMSRKQQPTQNADCATRVSTLSL